MTGFATLAMVNIDCADAPALAEFYHQVLGWEVIHSQDEYAMIGDGTTSIGFGQIEAYEAPQWPDPASPKQYHLDFYVDNLDDAEAQSLKLGAAKPEFQPDAERYRVLTDPAGHPYCICLKS